MNTTPPRNVIYYNDAANPIPLAANAAATSAPRSQAPTCPEKGSFCAAGSHVGNHDSRSRAKQCPAHGRSDGPPVPFDQLPVHVLGDRDAGVSQDLVNTAWRKISIPSARVLHRSCTRTSCGALDKGQGP
jgi:hypothetical protein